VLAWLLAAAAVFVAQSPVARLTGSLAITAGKTWTVNNTLTFAGTDASSVALGAGGTAVYEATAGRILCSTNVATATTSALSETNLAVCTIPANTITVGGIVRGQWFVKATGTNTGHVYVLRFSGTSGDTSGGLKWSESGTNGNISKALYKSFWQTGANAQETMSESGNDGPAVSASVNLTGSIDTTATSYINLNASVGDAADTIGYVSYTFTYYPPI